MSITLACALAVLLDIWLGEPVRWHPLAGFSRLAEAVEARLNPEGKLPRLKGTLALLALVVPAVAAVAILRHLEGAGLLVEVLLLYLALGGSSLAEHGRAVGMALAAGDLQAARQQVRWMVDHDAEELDQEGIARSAVESVLDNGNLAVFAPLLWFLALGAPGVVAYRLTAILNAMWGRKALRYRRFGRPTVWLFRLLNWPPVRITALTYGLLGDGRRAWRCWRKQAHHPSSASRIAVAVGAGALGLRLGGPVHQQGVAMQRPWVGEGLAPGPYDVARALHLVQNGLWLWLGIIAAADLLLF